MKIHTPEEIIAILRSIEKLSVKDGELDTWFANDPYINSITSFIPGSFTYDLLVVIENHLLFGSETNETDSQGSHSGMGEEEKAHSG